MTSELKINEYNIWEALKEKRIKDFLRDRSDEEFWEIREVAHKLKQNYFYVYIEVAHRYKEYVYMHPERSKSELEELFLKDKYGVALRNILNEDVDDNIIWKYIEPNKYEENSA